MASGPGEQLESLTQKRLYDSSSCCRANDNDSHFNENRYHLQIGKSEIQSALRSL